MSHVVPDLVQKVLRGQNPVSILGDGSQVRHYTYGGDLARGIVMSLDHPGALNEDFNLSTRVGHTVLELLALIWTKIHGDSSNLQILPEQGFEFDVQKRIPDTTKAEIVLGFEADTSLSEMLDEVIPWIQSAIRKGTI
jgi:nucleoside-diphosphate-sugar epimerase